MSAKKRTKLGKIIASASKQIELWNTSNKKATLQLEAITNIRGQLDSLPSERAPIWEIQSKLGALEKVPGLVPRLQSTILQSRERAHKFIAEKLCECLSKMLQFQPVLVQESYGRHCRVHSPSISTGREYLC